VFCFNIDKFGSPNVLLVFHGIALTFLSLLAGNSSMAILVVIVIMCLGKQCSILHRFIVHFHFQEHYHQGE